MENSITQENTTETMDISNKQPLASKSKHASKPTIKVNPTAHPSTMSSATKAKKRVANQSNYNRASLRNKNVHKDSMRPMRTHSSDEMNNSCSNITASTYLNGAEFSGSSGIGLDYESGMVGDPKSTCDRESVYSDGRLSRRSDRHPESLLLRRESSSTYERDMDIIDLLERERSMDMQEVLARERHSENYRKKAPNLRTNSGIERRKLPDIARITAPNSPKRLNSVEAPANFPNFVFTHQFNEFAEAQNNRNRDVDPNETARSRNNSQTSFGKRNSEAYLWNEDEHSVGSVSRVSRARSIDSRKNSTKSIHESRIIGTGNYSAYADL